MKPKHRNRFKVMFKSKCPKYLNIDRLTKEETKRTVHCQVCYEHYKYKNKFVLI